MAVVSRSFTPSDIFQGPADVYLGVQVPASAVPPVQYTNTLQLDANGQPPIGTKGEILTAIVGSTPGTGYAVGDLIAVTQSGAFGGLVRVLTAPAGIPATLEIIRGGGSRGYSAAANLATTGGSGNGALTVTITVTSGVHLGLTEGPASTSVTPKFELIKADQYSAPVDAAFISNVGEIDFTVKELVLANIQRFMAGLLSASYFDLGAGGTNPACDLLQIGSTPNSSALVTSLMLVAPDRSAANKFMYVLGYRCYIKSAIAMATQRGKETVIKMKWGILLDTTRVAKDQALQIIKMV